MKQKNCTWPITNSNIFVFAVLAIAPPSALGILEHKRIRKVHWFLTLLGVINDYMMPGSDNFKFPIK